MALPEPAGTTSGSRSRRTRACYNCQGPIDALVEAAWGRPSANNSPAELGARTVEILDAAYRSAASGVLERVKTLDRSPA